MPRDKFGRKVLLRSAGEAERGGFSFQIMMLKSVIINTLLFIGPTSRKTLLQKFTLNKYPPNITSLEHFFCPSDLRVCFALRAELIS